MRILVIDDEPLVLRSLARVLREHKVVCAANLAEAEVALRLDSFDLVLCDLNLPDGDGVEFRERFSEEQGPAFVLLTGDVAARELPGSVLTKPFTLDMVRRLVAELATCSLSQSGLALGRRSHRRRSPRVSSAAG